MQTKSGKILPLLLFLVGVGFVLLGLKTYPAFIAVGILFVVIGYRGYTYKGEDQDGR